MYKNRRKYKFLEKFFNGIDNNDYRIFSIFHKLIFKLLREDKRPWTVYSLQNYIDNIHTRAFSENLNNDISKNIGYLVQENGYLILNTNLFDKDREQIYFIAKDYIPLDNFGFFTLPELKKINSFTNDFINDCSKLNNVSFENIKYNLNEITHEIVINYPKSISIKDNERCEGYLKGWDHIIVDGIDNFPIEFINQYFNMNLHFLNENTIDHLKSKLLKEREAFENLKDILDSAIKETLALFKVRKNLVAPSYFSKKNIMSYLIPIYITDVENKKPDFVFLFNIKTDQDIIKEIDIETKITKEVDKYVYNKKIFALRNKTPSNDALEKELLKNLEDLIKHLKERDRDNIKLTIFKVLEYVWKTKSLTTNFECVKNDFEPYIDELVNHSIEINKKRFNASTLLNLDEAYRNLRLLNEENHYHWLF